MNRSAHRRLSSALLVLAITPGCTSTSEEGVSEERNQTALDPNRFRAIAPISGRLILPSKNERRPDGAVKIEIHEAEDRGLIGRTLWIRYDDAPEVRAKLRDLDVDVRFDDRTRESISKGNVHPQRIDGWAKVSPLESLAAVRPADDVLVALEGARVAGSEVIIVREPVQIAGDRVALFTVTSKLDETHYKVRHYEKRTRDFTSAEETLTFDAPPIPLGGNGLVHSPTTGIERSPANGAGFYGHGVIDDRGGFHVRALVPRSLRAIPSVNYRSGASSSLLFTTAGMWEPVATPEAAPAAKGSLSSTLLVPNAFPGEAGATRYRSEMLALGTELLVVHTFGSVGPAEKRARTGHFAFGVAKVVREPLTDELALDVEYRQIYAHNPNGIASGTHSWASYSGSFARGWMYGRPIADVALALPALTRTFDLDGLRFRPLDSLVVELDRMTARYRTGNGTGASIVTPANSCVQDSSKALFFSLVELEQNIVESPRVARFVSEHPTDPQVQDLKTLMKIADETEGYLSPLGITRRDWRTQANEVAAVSACPGGIAGAVFCGLASYRTIFPRKASDLYTESLLRAGAGGVVLRTNDIVGELPGIYPLSPTSPF